MGYSIDTSDDDSLITPPQHHYNKAQKEHHFKAQSDDSSWTDSDSDAELTNKNTCTFHCEPGHREKMINGNQLLYYNNHCE